MPYVPGREGVGVVKSGHLLPPGKTYWFETSGSMAELVTADEDRAIEVPYGIDDGTAAGSASPASRRGSPSSGAPS